MSLSYIFTLTAPAEAKPEELVKFLKGVERQAKKLGFQPTIVLNAPFDTPERRDFARRLTTGYPIQDDRLKGLAMPLDGVIWHHGCEDGTGRAVPEQGVVLVLTNERGQESVFGFLRYPEEIRDVNGKVIASTGLGGRWFFRNFIDSPDPRYRQIVKRFIKAGYVESEEDEFG
jgi:hypothetical protein